MLSLSPISLLACPEDCLGLNIALSALRAGHIVIATARVVDKAAKEYPAVKDLGGEWLKLDVRSEDTEKIVRTAVNELAGGEIDVVVNNAGHTVITSLEDVSISAITDMLGTHGLGAIRVLKRVLPFFCHKQSGTVVNMSRMLGQVALPAGGISSLCKFALEGASEALAAELATFGIRVVILEPGQFRTAIMTRDGVLGGEVVSEHYRNSKVGQKRVIDYKMRSMQEEFLKTRFLASPRDFDGNIETGL